VFHKINESHQNNSRFDVFASAKKETQENSRENLKRATKKKECAKASSDASTTNLSKMKRLKVWFRSNYQLSRERQSTKQ
jgi:hypothetical protein